MTTSTRVFLAVTAALVVILVLYYSLLSDGASPAVSRAESGPPPAVAPSPFAQREAPARSEPRRVIESPIVPPPSAPAAAAASTERASERVPERRVRIEGHAPVRLEVEAQEPLGKDAPPPVRVAEENVETNADGEGEAEGIEGTEEPTTSEEAEPAPRILPPPQREPVTRLTPSVAPPQYTEHTVKSGETMSSIAHEWFGDAAKWDLIAKANPLVDPARLRVGQVLRLPPKDMKREEITERAGSAPVVHTVRSGDTLSRIARAYYGHERHWNLIYDANRPTIGLNPNDLRVGMRLTIPPAPRPAPEN